MLEAWGLPGSPPYTSATMTRIVASGSKKLYSFSKSPGVKSWPRATIRRPDSERTACASTMPVFSADTGNSQIWKRRVL